MAKRTIPIATATTDPAPVPVPNTKTPFQLIEEHQALKAHLEVQTKAFAEYCLPARTRMAEIDALLMQMLNEQGVNSFATDAGTAYKSVILQPKIVEQTAYLDWVLEDWDGRSSMLKIGTPQVDELRAWMDQRRKERDEFIASNNGEIPQDFPLLPPGIETSDFVRLNVKKS